MLPLTTLSFFQNIEGLVGKVEMLLKQFIRIKCKALRIEIGKMEVMPNHVHLKAGQILGHYYIVQQIKGDTSRDLREKILTLKRKLPTLWTRSYLIESMAHISERTIKKYIADQKGK